MSQKKGGCPKLNVGEMSDSDDCEVYDDFMDEWVGCISDGSDSEDYWENW